MLITAIVAIVLGSLGICFAARALDDKTALIIVGLACLSPAVAVAGYSFLREEELEPYRGRELWIRATICGLVYAILWGVYWHIRPASAGRALSMVAGRAADHRRRGAGRPGHLRFGFRLRRAPLLLLSADDADPGRRHGAQSPRHAGPTASGPPPRALRPPLSCGEPAARVR